MVRFHSLVTPWLWPKSTREDPTLSVRIGRVLHWGFVASAVISVSIGLVTTVVAFRAHQASLTAISDWNKAHSANPSQRAANPFDKFDRPPANTASETDPWSQFPDAQKNAPDSSDVVNDNPPAEVHTAPENTLTGLMIGFVFLLIGRAIRYVVAAE